MSEDLRFIADAMLGKLARWMRTIGYDVEYERDMDDSVLVQRAIEQNRIILTRDTLLIKRRDVAGRYFFIESNEIGEQLRQVLERFKPDKGRFLMRCLRCNVELNDIEKAEVRDKVPPYVYFSQNDFSVCPMCGRIYWAGTHRERMIEDLEKLMAEFGENER